MKLLVWNMEWMNDLFVGEDLPIAFRPDTEVTAHSPKGKNVTVKMRRDDLAGVINELNPDIVVIVEGPSRPAELQLFFVTDVAGTWETTLQDSGESQELGIAVRTDQGKFKSPAFKAFDSKKSMPLKTF